MRGSEEAGRGGKEGSHDEVEGRAMSRKEMRCAGEEGMLWKRKGSSWMKRWLGLQKNVKLQIKINKLCKQRVSAIDSNELAKPFQMAVRKTWK